MNLCEPQHREDAKWTVLDEEQALNVAELFRCFGDSTRIRILSLLIEQEMCVGDIYEKLGMSQSAVSHQLRVMRSSGLLKMRKSGRHIHYSIKDQHIRDLYCQGLAHTLEK